MFPLSKTEELNISGGLLLTPLLTIKTVAQIIRNCIKFRFK